MRGYGILEGMQKRNRRALFWLAVVTFIFASWVVIRYAQGYAYDFSAGKFVRTGAIAVTVNTDAQLFIDDAKTGGTSFLGNRAGQEGLLPGSYALRVARDGYTSWHKTVIVEEGKLIDFPHVLILPTDDADLLALKAEASRSLSNSAALAATASKSKLLRVGDFQLDEAHLLDMRPASPSLVADRVLGFSVTDDSSRLLWWSRNEIWVLWLNNTDQQPYRSEGERQAITRLSVPIIRAAWFRDHEHIVIDVGNESYRILETDGRGGTNIIKL